MWDFSIGRSLALMAQTMPFIVLRCAVYFGIVLAYIVVTGIGSGIGWGIGGLGDEGFQASAAFWGGAAGFGITAAAMYFLREYILFMVKAGHIAVMVQLLDGKPMPGGKSQIEYAGSVVKSRFAQANVLFVLDQLAKGVITAITGLMQGIGSLLPFQACSRWQALYVSFFACLSGSSMKSFLRMQYGQKVRTPGVPREPPWCCMGRMHPICLRMRPGLRCSYTV